MNSREYWQAREAAQLQHNLTEEAEYDRRLAKIYQDMLDACQKEIDSFYAKYASAEGITLAEAKKRVSKMDVAAYERKAARYVAEKNFSKRANDELRLYNATMQINRLELLKANIGLELLAGHAELESFMAEILQGRTMDELRRQAGILGESVKNNAKAARAIVNSSFHNATFSDRIWMYQDLLRNELSSLLQSGLIQGKNPRTLARELRKTFDAGISNTERLMRTELARVQTGAQKESFLRNGFTEYTFVVNGRCCDICKALDGKHFKVEDMEPGKNAPPMHPNCRCSTAAWVDSDEYEAWLDFLSKGGTTEEWNDHGKSEWQQNNRTNLAKAIDSVKTGIENPEYTREEIFSELQKSPIGLETIRALRDSGAQILLTHGEYMSGARGDQRGNIIRIFENNIKNVRVAAQTVAHEMAHYRYRIGGCQHAEAICFAMEKMHLMGRDYLTPDEWETMKRLAIDNYPEYNWEEGGYGNYDQFDFVREK